ncbi:hypothetical protein, partial [Aeribacillus composti]|uniref:hypothetical protein n=1 Tax=Aeribacillus composti TaxID=1868734 RepID=UPI003D1A43CC
FIFSLALSGFLQGLLKEKTRHYWTHTYHKERRNESWRFIIFPYRSFHVPKGEVQWRLQRIVLVND